MIKGKFRDLRLVRLGYQVGGAFGERQGDRIAVIDIVCQRIAQKTFLADERGQERLPAGLGFAVGPDDIQRVAENKAVAVAEDPRGIRPGIARACGKLFQRMIGGFGVRIKIQDPEIVFRFRGVGPVVLQVVTDHRFYLRIRQTAQVHAGNILGLFFQADVRPGAVGRVAELAEVKRKVPGVGFYAAKIGADLVLGTVGDLIKMEGRGVHVIAPAGGEHVADEIKSLDKGRRIPDGRGGGTADDGDGGVQVLDRRIDGLQQGRVIKRVRLRRPEQQAVVRFVPYFVMPDAQGGEIADQVPAIAGEGVAVFLCDDPAPVAFRVDRIVVIQDQVHVDIP